MSGIHENLLKLQLTDPDLARTTLSLDWLSITNNIEYFARTSIGGYHMLNYTPISAIAVQLYCAQNTKIHKIEWPFKDKSEHYKKNQKENIIHSIVTNPAADTKSRSLFMGNRRSVVTEVLSYVYDVFTPKIRPIPYTALSDAEKEVRTVYLRRYMILIVPIGWIIILYNILYYYDMICCIILCYVILYSVILGCVMLRYVMLLYITILYYISNNIIYTLYYIYKYIILYHIFYIGDKKCGDSYGILRLQL
jgi:hypothetical protein